jgi:hypothetical protein
MVLVCSFERFTCSVNSWNARVSRSSVRSFHLLSDPLYLVTDAVKSVIEIMVDAGLLSFCRRVRCVDLHHNTHIHRTFHTTLALAALDRMIVHLVLPVFMK